MKLSTTTILLILTLPLVTQAQHGHLNVGAAGTSQNDQLNFPDAGDFMASSGYVKTLSYTNAGRFADYYEGNITLTVLPATPAHSGPEPGAPAIGSFIHFKFSCLHAPPGGEFGFWDAGTTEPSLALSAGQSSTNLWRLTEADGSPDSDPYGHIHGRRFTATTPGFYQIAFSAIDLSTNGLGGGAIHLESDPLPVWFQAGINLQVALDTPPRLSFAAPAGTRWQLETTSDFDPVLGWDPIGPIRTADDYMKVFVDDTAPLDGARFYRLRQMNP